MSESAKTRPTRIWETANDPQTGQTDLRNSSPFLRYTGSGNHDFMIFAISRFSRVSNENRENRENLTGKPRDRATQTALLCLVFSGRAHCWINNA